MKGRENFYLTNARILSGLSQEEMAERMDCCVGTICNYERKPGNVKLNTLKRWFDACNPEGKKYMRDNALLYFFRFNYTLNVQ